MDFELQDSIVARQHSQRNQRRVKLFKVLINTKSDISISEQNWMSNLTGNIFLLILERWTEFFKILCTVNQTKTSLTANR